MIRGTVALRRQRRTQPQCSPTHWQLPPVDRVTQPGPGPAAGLGLDSICQLFWRQAAGRR